MLTGMKTPTVPIVVSAVVFLATLALATPKQYAALIPGGSPGHGIAAQRLRITPIWVKPRAGWAISAEYNLPDFYNFTGINLSVVALEGLVALCIGGLVCAMRPRPRPHPSSAGFLSQA